MAIEREAVGMMVCESKVSLSRSEVAHLRVGNSTDFNPGGLELARTRSMKKAIRVLEHASQIATRAASNSTSTTTTTGRLARQLEDYVTRLKRIEKQGHPAEFFMVLQNAQMKLVNLVCKMLR
jgi:hypothetical protein